MRHLTTPIVALLLLFTLGGCAPQGPGRFDSVSFERTGGLAGVDQQLRLHEDGALGVEYDGSEVRAEAPPEQVERIRDLAMRIDWDDLEPAYTGDRAYDVYHYRVTLTTRHGEGGGQAYRRSVVLDDLGLGGAPTALRQLVEELSRLFIQAAEAGDAP